MIDTFYAKSMGRISENAIIITYAKIIDDKEDGIYIQGVYFGGIADTKMEAESIARECVNTIKGGTIIPKLIPTQGIEQVLPAMQVAKNCFNQMEMQMFQAEDIINRTQNSRKRCLK